MSSEVAVEMYGGRWKRYPAYRDSGVEWLGEVPEGWELLRTKQLAKRIQTGSTPPTQERHYYENGSVPWFGPGSFSTDLLLDKPIKVISKIAVKDGVARIFKGQSTMIVTIGATIGKVGYIESSASSNQQITVVTFDITRANPKFAAYQMKRLEPVLRGIAPNTTLPILNQDDIGHLPFCLPSLSEQRAIAAFLDSETGRIDTFIEKKERQIELLQEKRAALISQAVTKGLDPYAKMKDSGVEWLGEVPEHWDVRKFNHIADNISVGFVGSIEKHYTDETGVLLLKTGNIGLNKLLLNDVSYVTREFHDANVKSQLSSGDIIIARHGDSGKSAVIPDNISEANCLNIVKLKKSNLMNGDFFTYLLNSNKYQQFLKASQGGSVQGVINTSDIIELKVVLPPLKEQLAIAALFKQETRRIDSLENKVQESISKLSEYRTSLISATVTGKIDVRQEAA